MKYKQTYTSSEDPTLSHSLIFCDESWDKDFTDGLILVSESDELMRLHQTTEMTFESAKWLHSKLGELIERLEKGNGGRD